MLGVTSWLCSRGHDVPHPLATIDGRCAQCWIDAENELRAIRGLPELVPDRDPALTIVPRQVLLSDVKVCRRGHYKWQQPSGDWTCQCHTQAQARYRKRHRAPAA